jgi:cell division protein FtsB
MPAATKHARRAGRRRLRFWLVLAVGACLTGVLYYGPVKAYVSTSHQLAERKAEVEQLAHEKAVLERRLSISGTGEALLEEARRLGYVRPGEHLFVVRGVKAWLKAHAGSTATH